MPRKAYNQRLTDEDVLALFDAGKYSFNADWEILAANGQPLFTYEGSRGGQYRWVRLYDQPRHRAIAVHVVVWIVTNRSAVPPGWQVHRVGKSTTMTKTTKTTIRTTFFVCIPKTTTNFTGCGLWYRVTPPVKFLFETINATKKPT